MSQPTPIRTPQPPTIYALTVPAGKPSELTGVAATCPHCDWTILRPYPRGTRHGTDRAQALAEQLEQDCAEHKNDHLVAYVANALAAAIGPLGSAEMAVQRLKEHGLAIIADPDWKPQTEPVADEGAA